MLQFLPRRMNHTEIAKTGSPAANLPSAVRAVGSPKQRPPRDKVDLVSRECNRTESPILDSHCRERHDALAWATLTDL